MKHLFSTLLAFTATLSWAAESITIVVPKPVDTVIETAAADLRAGLEQTYSDITVTTAAKPSGKSIFLYTNADAPAALTRRPDRPEGFVISTKGDAAYIIGSDPAGVVYGVHQLLEKSEGTHPAAKSSRLQVTLQ